MFQSPYRKQQFQRNRPFRRGGFRNNSGGNNRGKPSINPASYTHKAIDQAPIPAPVIRHQFEDFLIEPVLKQNIRSRGYLIPTPIQDQTIPLILDGKDVIGIANTGTGKTAAFLIPLINKIIRNRSQRVLIIVPTRELAVQIQDELREFSKSLNIFSLLVMGGVSMHHQIVGIRRSPHFIISTPGRLKDLMTKRLINLLQFKNIVLDEVDRMVDIGFLPDIKYIISQIPRERQSLFFSATVSNEVNTIIQSFLKDPVTVSVKVNQTAQGIDQEVIRIRDKNEKVEKLHSMLKQSEFKKVLVFGRTKWGVERLSKTLQQRGVSVASIHGNKSQNQRLRALSQFKQNQLQVLVATDVAARGIDVEDISHVINFDEPSTYTDYIHRIGRTGRANKTGKAFTFVD